jgi:hypothetical protein
VLGEGQEGVVAVREAVEQQAAADRCGDRNAEAGCADQSGELGRGGQQREPVELAVQAVRVAHDVVDVGRADRDRRHQDGGEALLGEQVTVGFGELPELAVELVFQLGTVRLVA